MSKTFLSSMHTVCRDLELRKSRRETEQITIHEVIQKASGDWKKDKQKLQRSFAEHKKSFTYKEQYCASEREEVV